MPRTLNVPLAHCYPQHIILHSLTLSLFHTYQHSYRLQMLKCNLESEKYLLGSVLAASYILVSFRSSWTCLGGSREKREKISALVCVASRLFLVILFPDVFPFFFFTGSSQAHVDCAPCDSFIRCLRKTRKQGTASAACFPAKQLTAFLFGLMLYSHPMADILKYVHYSYIFCTYVCFKFLLKSYKFNFTRCHQT